MVAVHYLKKSQLLDGDERQSWYMGGRSKIFTRYGYTQNQFVKAMSDAMEKYPELLHDW